MGEKRIGRLRSGGENRSAVELAVHGYCDSGIGWRVSEDGMGRASCRYSARATTRRLHVKLPAIGADCCQTAAIREILSTSKSEAVTPGHVSKCRGAGQWGGAVGWGGGVDIPVITDNSL